MLARDKKADRLYAVKMLSQQETLDEGEVGAAFTEREVLTLGSQNRFITQLHSTFRDSETLYYVMEFQTGGDLLFHLQRRQPFSPSAAAFYAAEITLGLQFLHTRGILYRDLKEPHSNIDRAKCFVYLEVEAFLLHRDPM